MDLLEMGEWIISHGSEGVLIMMSLLWLRGDVLSKSAVENIVKLVMNEVGEKMEKAVENGVLKAQIDLVKQK